jgi:uncharacterized protein YjgD (DUF1641 family)
MSQPIRLEFPPRDARAELLTRLQNAPLQHAEALLSGYDLLQRLHDRGVLDLLRGGLGSSDKVLSIAVDAAKAPEAINATRNLLILSKILVTMDPELLENIVTAVPNSLARASEQKPFSLWQMFKTMCSQDTRRALSAMLGLLESFGKSLGSPSAAQLERLESELAEIGCVVALDRRGR